MLVATRVRSAAAPRLELPAFPSRARTAGTLAATKSFVPLGISPRAPSSERMGRRQMRANAREYRRPGVDPLYDLFFQGLRGERGLMDMFDRILQLDEIANGVEVRRISRDDLADALGRVDQRRRGIAEEDLSRPTEEEAPKPKSYVDELGGPKVKKEIPVTAFIGKKSEPRFPELQKDESENGYVYKLDVLGVEPGNLNLQLQDNMLIVEGKMMTKTNDGYHSSTFKRSFALPFDVDMESLKASELQDGRLQVEILKKKLESTPEPPAEKEIPIFREDSPPASA